MPAVVDVQAPGEQGQHRQQRAQVQRPPGHGEAQFALLDAVLEQLGQVVIGEEDQQGHDQVGRAAGARIDEAERDRQQHQDHAGDRRRNAVQQFGVGEAVVLGGQDHRGRERLGRGVDADHRHRAADAHAVAFEFHRLEVGLARMAHVAPPVLEHQVLAALAVRLDHAFLGDHHRVAVFLDAVDEDVLHDAGTAGAALDEEHAVGRRGFAELARRHALEVFALFEALDVFGALHLGPGRGEEGQSGDQDHQRQAECEHRRDPARQRLAGGEPDHHFRVAVAARDGGDHGNKAGQNEDGWQIIQHGKTDQRQDIGRSDFAARGLAEDGNQGPGDEDRKQDGERCAGYAGQFTL
jgi:hypothetical protein